MRTEIDAVVAKLQGLPHAADGGVALEHRGLRAALGQPPARGDARGTCAQHQDAPAVAVGHHPRTATFP